MTPTSTKDKIMTCLLTPLSWVYGTVVYIRNKMFDKHILEQVEFDIPVVSVGNLTVGGTGKTPHVEHLVRSLEAHYNIAIVSRGYKRTTRGYVLANAKSTPDTIGDEPYQMYQKFGSFVKVAVCEKRTEAIKNLRKEFPEINLVILDDAFQHRYIKPKVSILLMDYNRPIHSDHLLPLGRLRESDHGMERADIIIVTKCPAQLTPIDMRLLFKELAIRPFQKLFFSRYNYQSLRPVFPDDSPYRASLDSLSEDDRVLLLTGIAHPRYFVRHFKQFPFKKKVCHFPDHHKFTRSDIDRISGIFDDMKGKRKIIITTEKDAVRLSNNPYYPQHLKAVTYFLPIEVDILGGMKGEELIPSVVKAIEAKENPLNSIYSEAQG